MAIPLMLCICLAGQSGDRAAERFSNLKKEFQKADAEYFQKVDKELTPEERGRLSAPHRHTSNRQMLSLARDNRKTAVARQALLWVLIARWADEATRNDALEQFLTDHATDEELVDDLYWFDNREWAPSLYRPLIEKSPHRDVKALSCYYLANLLIGDDLSKGKLSKSQEASAVCLLERIAREFADLPHPYRDRKGESLGTAAKEYLFEIEHLQTGRPAPEISGEDVEGLPFKLSDYRGRVVLLVFCGHWCGPCVAMYPQERELVQRLKDRPFQLLWVNSDSDRDELQRARKEHDLTWRMWWDGGIGGPIASEWNIRAWPTLYVIDPHGVIRFKGRGLQDFSKAEEVVDSLLMDNE